MTKSKNYSTNEENLGAPLSKAVRDSAQQIWQAGLGAFQKAQVEGGKAFDALVKDGITLQKKSQSVAESKFTEASQKVTAIASELTQKASGQWDKLENVFEDRVAKVLNKMGIPTAKDMAFLVTRINELNERLLELKVSEVKSKASNRKTLSTKPKSNRTSSKASPKVAKKVATTKKV